MRAVEARRIHQDYKSPTPLVPESDRTDLTRRCVQLMAYTTVPAFSCAAYELRVIYI